LEQVLNEPNNYKLPKTVAKMSVEQVAPQQTKLKDETTKISASGNKTQGTPSKPPNSNLQALKSMRKDLKAMLQRYTWAEVKKSCNFKKISSYSS
jgi:hypothetical protein